MLATEPSAAKSPASLAPSQSDPLDWKRIIGPVEPFLEAVHARLLGQVEAFDEQIASLARYALTGHGKQLRPSLVALSAGATGHPQDAHAEAAVIIEMIHLATLVHDDVMDEASIRRSRPTLAANWGNEIAVLLGDCLFAHALKLAAGFPTTEICRAVANSTNIVCAGEILQTQRRHQFHFSREEYIKVLQMKTGELFALSCDLGAYLNDAPPEHRDALRRFGMALGTAYQIFDDCLDLFGQESVAGKSLGTDLAKGKMTLPVLLLLENAKASDRKKLEVMLREWRSDEWPSLLKHLEAHRVLGESRRVVDEYLHLAGQLLKPLPKSEGRTGLLRLIEFLGRQMARLAEGRS